MDLGQIQKKNTAGFGPALWTDMCSIIAILSILYIL